MRKRLLVTMLILIGIGLLATETESIGIPNTGSKTTTTRDLFNEYKLLASDGAASDDFGESVSIFGDYALIGAYVDDDNGSSSGSAYVFHYDGTNWIQQAKLTASDGSAYDYFGYSVSLSGEYALISAVGEYDSDSSYGSVYVFHYDGSTWSQQAILTASDGTYYDFFGNSVFLSGDYALIGAMYDDNGGSAYIFYNDGDAWTEQAKLTSTDGAVHDHFGCSVSLSGDYALIGAYEDDDNGYDSGSAYIFHYDGSAWTQQAKLTASDGDAHESFGRSVSLFGYNSLIGAFADDENGNLSGSAYIFHYNGNDWTQQAKLTASDGASDDRFGLSVSLSGDYALIGAYGDDGNDYNSGSTYIFNDDGTTWTQQAKLTASDGAYLDYFGRSVSLSGDYALIGVYGDDDNGNSSGSAYVFHISEDSADFSADQTTVTVGTEIQFTDLSTGTPTSWQWDFNNDGIIDSNEQNPSFTYTTEGTYTVSLTISDGSVTIYETKEDYINVDATSAENEMIPSTSKLVGSFPNPFNNSTTIQYDLKQKANIRIEIFNTRGQKVVTLLDGNKDADLHSVIWNGNNSSNDPVSSGLYLYKLTVDNKLIDIKKCVLMKIGK